MSCKFMPTDINVISIDVLLGGHSQANLRETIFVRLWVSFRTPFRVCQNTISKGLCHKDVAVSGQFCAKFIT